LNDFGCGTLGDSNGQSRFTGTYTIADSLSWIHGNHNVKFGANHARVYSNSFNAFSSRAADSFNVFSTLERLPSTSIRRIHAETQQRKRNSSLGAVRHVAKHGLALDRRG